MADTYKAVGQALSAWTGYEDAVGTLFEFFVTSRFRSDAARRALQSVHSFEGRNEMLRAAGDAYFGVFPDNRMKKQLREVLKFGKLFNERRNEIAHGMVVSFPTLAAAPAPATDGFCLEPISESRWNV